MNSYLKTQPSYSPFSSHSYDIYNPFSSSYPKPPIYQKHNAQSPSLTRNLTSYKQMDCIEQFRQQSRLIQSKENQYHEILYGEGRKYLPNSGSYSNLQSFSRFEQIQRNPFLQGEPSSIKELKEQHANAKVLFTACLQKQQERRIQNFDERQQNQLKLRQTLQNKQFKTLLQLKNLDDYRKIKQAETLKKHLETQRKSLLNVASTPNKGSKLFSFGNEDSKRFNLGLSSRFDPSSSKTYDYILGDWDDDVTMTFSGHKNTQAQGFRQAKRPPMIKKIPTEEKDSLESIRVNGVDSSPKTIKLKNKTFYLIAA